MDVESPVLESSSRIAMRWRTKWRWKERNGKTSMPLPQRERLGALGCCNPLTFWSLRSAIGYASLLQWEGSLGEGWDKGRDQRWRCERWVEAREAWNILEPLEPVEPFVYDQLKLPCHWRMRMLQLPALLSGRAPKRKRRRRVKQ